MSNLRFPKVFVLDPTTDLVTGNTIKPSALTLNQVGLHVIDQYSVVGVGATATPTATAIQIHQNLGDTKFGTTRTQPIFKDKVKAFYGVTAAAAQQQIIHLGWNGTDSDIAALYNTEIVIHFTVYSKKLARWFGGSRPYKRSIVINTGVGTGAAPKAVIAQAIADAVNGVVPANSIGNGNELPNFLTAAVTTGGGGEKGVSITTKAISPELLNSADPIKFYEVELVTVEAFVSDATGVVIPVTQTQAALSGNGFPAELAAAEAESQGYDRVREIFENPRFMKTNYIIRAADGKKYDYLHLIYEYEHQTGPFGATNGKRTETYEVIIAGPTTTLQATANVFNSWLTGKFPTVTL